YINHHACLPYWSPQTPDHHTLSLHDALPISFIASVREEVRNQAGAHVLRERSQNEPRLPMTPRGQRQPLEADHRVAPPVREPVIDRKSTRLNSSHVAISYAVFCLKKKKNHYL